MAKSSLVTGKNRKPKPEAVEPTKLPPPVFLEGEDDQLYARLLEQVTAAVGPRDIIEEFLVRDVMDLQWEVIRFRRLKACLLNAHAAPKITDILSPLIGDHEADRLGGLWRNGDRDGIETVKQELEKGNLSIENVMAETLVLKLDEVERIDHIIARAEARRVSILREMDRHRTALATSLRQATQAIEDAEFSEVPGQPQQPSTAA